MLNFFYDSLDTVKKLKHPTKKEFINLTIAILVVVLLSGIFFIAADYLFQTVYQGIYDLIQ